MNILELIRKVLPQGFVKFMYKYTHSIIEYYNIRQKFLEDLRYIVDYHKSNSEWIEKKFLEYEKSVIALLQKNLKKGNKE